MKKIRCECDVKTLVPLVFFLILFTSCLFYGIDDPKLREREVVIEIVDGQSVYILNQDENQGIFNDSCKDQMLSQGWTFISKEEGYLFDMLCIAGNKGDQYTVSLTEDFDQKLVFWKHYGGGKISVHAGGKTETVDLFDSENKEESYVILYPFQDSIWSFFIRLLQFMLTFIIVGVVFFVLAYLVKRIFKEQSRYTVSAVKIVAVLFTLFFLFDIFYYTTGRIPNFLVFGDQCKYWGYLWGKGMAFETAAKEIRVWNGYLCFYIPYVIRTIGSVVPIDPVYIWFMLTSASGAVLCGFTMPELFHIITGKKAGLGRISLFTLVFFIFWHNALSAVLMDLVGTGTFLLAVVLLLRLTSRKRKIIHAFVIGALFSISISFRSVYLYASILLLVFSAVCYIRKHKASFIDSLKKLIPVVLTAACGFFIVCIPQKKINEEIGVNSFFPCANREVWEKGTYGRSLTEYSLDMTLSGSFTGWPYTVADRHADSMKEKYENTIITMSQGLDLLMSQPMDTIVFIGKKLFIGFDTKTSVSYPDFSLKKDARFFLYSFFNYFAIGTAIYAFVKSPNIKGRIFTAFIFCLVILPHTWTHVEWRYFLIGYIMLYFWFAFFFKNEETGNWAGEESSLIRNWKYWMYIDLYIAISFMISLDFYAGVI